MCFPDCTDEGAFLLFFFFFFYRLYTLTTPLKITNRLVLYAKIPPLLKEFFYLYAVFAANATNEKWRSGPRETLRPGNWHCDV